MNVERRTLNAGPARPAASVILGRASPTGEMEIFMVRRAASSRFAPDAFVFPGGAVQDDDYGERAASRVAGLTFEAAHERLVGRGSEPPASPQLSLGFHVAAVRELFEEAGVLLAADEQGKLIVESDQPLGPGLTEERARLQSGRAAIAEVVERHGWYLACEQLLYFSHWVTPEVAPRRFDTRFFFAAMPAGQTALHCEIETTEGEWLRPVEALARAERGELKLVFATIEHLKLLARFRSLDEALRFAARKPVTTVRPVRDGEADRWILPAEW